MGLFRYRKGRDVEPFGGVDVHGVDIRSPQTLDLLDGLNQEPVFEKRGWNHEPSIPATYIPTRS